MLKSMAGLTDDYIHTVTSGLFRVSNLHCMSLDSRRIGTAQNPFAVHPATTSRIKTNQKVRFMSKSSASFKPTN